MLTCPMTIEAILKVLHENHQLWAAINIFPELRNGPPKDMTTEQFSGKMITAFNLMTTIDRAGDEASNI